MHIKELKQSSPQQLLKMAEDKGIENASQLDVKQLRFAVLSVIAADKKTTLVGVAFWKKCRTDSGFSAPPNQIIWRGRTTYTFRHP